MSTKSGLQGANYLAAGEGDPCVSAYEDVADGAQVTVKDGNGMTLGLGRLSPGVVTTYSRCLFTFSVADVPETPFYAVEVSHRGAQQYSLAELTAANFDVKLRLG